MKKLWLFVLWLCTVLFTWNFTQAKDYEYSNLDITANILIDGTIDVKENFTANFFVNKHWIIRDIPLNYSVWWKDFHIDVSNINVQWKNFTTNKNNGNVEIKIWDADRTVIWRQNYPISYSTYGLIRNFSWMWYAELYWNLVGNQFDTNINNVRTELILPKTYTWFTKDDFLITTDWKSKTIDWFGWTVDWSHWDKIIITYDKWLAAYQGITLAIRFPNNYFEFDHGRQARLVWHIWNKTNIIKNSWNKEKIFSLSNLLTWISIFFIFGAGFMFLKFFRSKDWALRWKFAKQFPTIIQYNPPEWLHSAEVWLLLHRWESAKDMLSLIYKRAQEGLINISIEENEESTSSWSKEIINIKRNHSISEDSPDYEYKLFNSLIPGKENEIDPSKHLDFNLDTSIFEKYGVDKWRFSNTTDNHSKKLIILWIIFFWVFMFMWKFNFLASICPGIILIFFIIAHKWLSETEEWAKLISHILWYKEFLASCDENKLKLFLQEDPLYFDKTLPYAIIFWLETELIEKITPIMKEMNIKSNRYNWDIANIASTIATISSFTSHAEYSSYSSDSWFDSWSSFDSGWSSFDSWGGWGWWWGSSW